MFLLEINILENIKNKYGSPVYVFEEERFINNFNKLSNAFRNIYSNYIIGYSYKTNYTPYICNIVKDLGGYAEVVSDMEYELAKKLGYKNDKIIYNGPCKGVALEEHILNGGICNIDNLDEAKRIVKIANDNPKITIDVGIRLNIDIGAGYISRFGIEDDEKKFQEIISTFNKKDNISIVGLHCHISRARGIEAWKQRIDKLIDIADKYLDNIPRYIDVGSGMFGEMDESLAEQFDIHIPNYDEYAEIVAGAMKKKYGDTKESPMLISEPGTTVVANYLSLITTVDNIRETRGKKFVTVDASYYNTGEICLIKKLPYLVLRNGHSVEKKDNIIKDIMGYTCLEQDCIYKEFNGEIQEGDNIVFGNLGGYSIVSKPPFIRPNCAMVSYTKENKIIEIKREETFDDIFTTFRF